MSFDSLTEHNAGTTDSYQHDGYENTRIPREFHEYAMLFPQMNDDEMAALAEDIQANGQREKIKLLDGKILDGCNRYKACLIAKVTPEFEEFTGGDPLNYVVSANVRRRHLNESQRALIGAYISSMELTNNKFMQKCTKISMDPDTVKRMFETKKVSQNDAATLMNVSPRIVQTALRVLESNEMDILKAVRSGELRVSTAHSLLNKRLQDKKDVEAGLFPPKPMLTLKQEIAEMDKRLKNEPKNIPTVEPKYGFTMFFLKSEFELIENKMRCENEISRELFTKRIIMHYCA